MRENLIITSSVLFMAYGIPCRIVRPITQAEYDEIRISTQEYQEYKAEYERQEQENDSLL